ncbi:GNAT family N-acetyltransferase [Metabacillus indicus]|uniref:GNAT family N-acetyltransferase n=1 Tax=Metabacillus indicus TaxID=246786 RepID=UPI000492EF3F|nr:GNAT family N-acetyltransferase [Metabacillus indicus]KEZ48174.1 GNAT family acetyltransferase [Metabacillus indicus LMG 22858]
MGFIISKENNQTYKNFVNQNLYEYNAMHFPEDLNGRYEEVNVYLKDESGLVRGGILCEICWNWLEIHTLMIDEDLRHSGYGSQLLAEAEKIAAERDCDFVKVDTLSFQAVDFYKKHGYEVYGTLDGVGRDFKHHYLKKDL